MIVANLKIFLGNSRAVKVMQPFSHWACPPFSSGVTIISTQIYDILENDADKEV